MCIATLMDSATALRKVFLRPTSLCVSVFALLLMPSLSRAENPPNFNSLAATGEVGLSVKECVSIALENNLDIRVERQNPRIGEKEVIKEKAEFDPVASVWVSNQKSVTSGTSLLSGAGSTKVLERLPGWEDTLDLEGLDFSAGVSKKLFTGGEYALELTNNRYRSNSIFQFYGTTYRSDVVLSVNQPLLKGFGTDITKSKITVANNNQNISEFQFKQKVMDIVSEVQEIYWDLSFCRESLKVEMESLKLAQDLLERNKALVQVGKLPPLEILQAQVGMASREEAVVVAEGSVMDAQDQLRRVLNFIETVEEDGQTIIPTDKPRLAVQRICLQEAVESAIKNRPEYQQAQINFENKTLALRVAKNLILPALNLEGSYGLNGIDKSYHGGIEELADGDRYSWHVGINLQYPLGNRKAKSDYLAKELELKKTTLFLDQVKKKIIVEVKSAVRAVHTNQERIRTTQEARRLAEKRLEVEEERYGLGLSTTIDLLERQEDVAVAKGKEVKALIDYNKSLVALERVAGITLEKNAIELEDEEVE